MTIVPTDYATPLFCAGEVTVSYNPAPAGQRQRISTSLDAFTVLRQYWSAKIALVEEFYVLCLNAANEVVGIYLVSTGGVSATIADPKIVFTVALGTHASKIIIAHNHPSGQMAASQADINLTRTYEALGKMMCCPLLDHLILGPDPGVFLSFVDEKLIHLHEPTNVFF
jgi:DNA repair protein RadC